MNDSARRICRFSDLADPGARAFLLGSGNWPLKGFVVRKGERVWAYANRCPHQGHPLNFFGDDFLTADQTLLICRSHGACFDIATGICVAGPCAGASLRALEIRIEDDAVLLAGDADELAAELA